mmetsp:Transcript_18777/g.28348  ORF Transcript_18777/g.28348 Transcript_18777/m.28348 type:complete len:229 (-) Transcript_18777:270-956(-)
MRTTFSNGQITIANFEHIWIEPMSRTGSMNVLLGLPKVTTNATPRWVDVSRRAPDIAHAGSPLPTIFETPLTDGIKDGSARGIQSIFHRRISINAGNVLGIAIVVFQIIDTPRGEGLGIYLFVMQRSWESLARVCSRTCIQTKFKSTRVQGIRQSWNARWKLLGVCLVLISVSRAIGTHPTIIDIQILVAKIYQIMIQHNLCRYFNFSFINITMEGIPRIPPHGRYDS